MKPQMFSILNILMKKQRLKDIGKLYFLTMSFSWYSRFQNLKIHEILEYKLENADITVVIIYSQVPIIHTGPIICTG